MDQNYGPQAGQVNPNASQYLSVQGTSQQQQEQQQAQVQQSQAQAQILQQGQGDPQQQAQAQQAQQQAQPQGQAFLAGLPDQATATTTVTIQVPKATYEAAQLIDRAFDSITNEWPGDGNMFSKGAFITQLALRYGAPFADKIATAKAELGDSKLAFCDAIYIGLKPILTRFIK